jgi:hypothetical protein
MASMDDLGSLFTPIDPGVGDPRLLTAVGGVIVNSTRLEYAIAVLVALTEKKHGDEREDRALEIVSSTGEAHKQLNRLSELRPKIKHLCDETSELLGSRNLLMHSLILGYREGGGQPAMAIYDPRKQTETVVSLDVANRYVEYFKQNYDRFKEAIAEEIATVVPDTSEPGR